MSPRNSDSINYAIYACLFFAIAVSLIYPNIALILLLIVFPSLCIKTKFISNLFLCYVIFFIAFILAGKTIDGEGNDYVTYLTNLENGTYPGIKDSIFDFFFWSVAAFITSILPRNGGFELFFIVGIISFIPYLPIYNFLSRHLGNPLSVKIISLYFLFLISSLSYWNLYGNYIRQAWSFSFFLLTALYLSEKKFLYCLIFGLLSLVSHNSGAIFIFLLLLGYILSHEKLKIIQIVVITLSFLTMFFSPLSLVSHFLPSHIVSKISFYEGWSGSDFGKVAVLRLYALFAIVFCANKITKISDEHLRKWYSINYSISCVFILTASAMSIISKIVERLYYPAVALLFILLSVQICIILNNIKNRGSKNLYVMILFIVLFPLLSYSLYTSLYYNPYFYNGNLSEFLFYTYTN
ncbi:EpsG family protein [Dryocola sp. BD626]|uniref:EpsG family protein n=1 Tax=Dryocola sp. BD626 TaxID=3133273 RepID=UPI003F500062